jgi:hypothetical protein
MMGNMTTLLVVSGYYKAHTVFTEISTKNL